MWIKWIVYRTNTQFKNKGKNLRLGYLTQTFVECNFGVHNTIGAKSELSYTNLGDFSYVDKNCRISRTHIGKFCSIGPEVIMGLGRHPSKTFISTHPIFYSTLKQNGISFTEEQRFIETAEIKIGNDVWIGARVIIQSGLEIGDGVIIGSGAVVTKNIPPYAVVVGVPAKIIRYRFTEKEIESLNRLKWWDKDIGWLSKNYSMFYTIDNLNLLIESVQPNT